MINIIFLGHVDTGKSTLSGQLLIQNNAIDDRTIDRIEEEAIQLGKNPQRIAFIMDCDEGERKTGTTQAIITRHFYSSVQRGSEEVQSGLGPHQRGLNKCYTIIDAPGHHLYLSSAIEGINLADIGIVVISARKGEFEAGFDKGITKTHFRLLRILHINNIIILINKMDDKTVNWDNELYSTITQKLSMWLKKLGWKNNKQFCFIPVSGLKGYGITKRIPTKISPWCRDLPSLNEYLDLQREPDRLKDKILRLPIQNTYELEGKRVIVGRIESGILSINQEIVILPNKDNLVVTIHKIIHNDEEIKTALSGFIVIIHIKDKDNLNIQEGDVVTNPSGPEGVTGPEGSSTLKVTNSFHAQLNILNSNVLITNSSQYNLHLHSIKSVVVIDQILAEVCKENKIIEKFPKYVRGSDNIIIRIMVRLLLPELRCVDVTFDKMSTLLLHDKNGNVIAGGKVRRILQPYTTSP